jgi:hypothetical protein
MFDSKTRTSCLATMALAGILAGCAQTPPEPLTPLPSHELDLRALPVRPQPVRLVATAPKARQVDDHPWAAKRSRPWRYIVIHHSASDFGSAAILDEWHRGPSFGFDELGYHFVIDNGRGGADGAVEVGSRWHKQKWGAHTGGTPDNEYNNYGIGICLIGEFTRKLPSPAQLRSLHRLTEFLTARYNIPPEHVIGHRDAPDAHTDCPGDMLHRYIYDTLRPQLARQLFVSK